MKIRRKSIFGARGKRIGLVFVREQGLDLEIWDGGSCPCWSMGIVCTETDSLRSGEMIDVPKVSRWVLVIPTHLCTTRCIQLPSSRPDEIAAMLEFEVPQLVPCSTQPWTWDFCIAGQKQDGISQILVILSPLSVIESAMDRVQAIGIEPCLATVNAVLRAARLTRSRDIERAGLCGCAWWDHGSLDFFAMDGPQLVFMRGTRVNGHNSRGLRCAEAETVRSVGVLREWATCEAELPIRVGGMNSEIPLLVERLGQRAFIRADQVYPSETFDRTFVRDGVTSANSLSSWRNGCTRTACINLLPKHRKEKDRRARRRRELLSVGLRACLVILLLLLCLRMSVWRQTRLLGRYQQRLAQIAPQAQKLQFLQGQLNVIQTQVQGSVSMLDILGQLYEVLPEDVTIHYLSIDQNRQVVVRAQATWLSQAFDCIDPLEQSKYLSNVRQSYAHLRELEGHVLIDFELRADLEKVSLKEIEL